MPPSPSLSRVKQGDLCTGCGACQSIAGLNFGLDDQGFLRPTNNPDVSPEDEQLLAAVCPGLSQSVSANGRKEHPLWGPYERANKGFVIDPALRHRAASGGGLSGVLLHLMNTGEIDGVVHVAADPDNVVANRVVVSRSAKDIAEVAGSRYAPSSPLTAMPDCVETGSRYALVGKPCDVAALRSWQAVDSAVAQAFPVLISFFCAGVPSLKGAKAILDDLEVAQHEVAAFRYRGHGWPGRATATLKNGSDRSLSYQDSWGKILSKHVQHRCKICADGAGVAADIVCADAWEVDAKGYPKFEERDGTSLILARTALGLDIVRQAEKAGQLRLDDFEIDDLQAMQPGQVGRRRALAARLLGLRLMGRAVPQYRGMGIFRAGLQNSVLGNLKNCLGMMRRVFRARRQRDLNPALAKVRT